MRPPSAVLREALHCYAAGHVADALRVLDAIPAGDPLPDHPAWDVATVERRADAPAAPATVSAAVRDWVEVARDRLRHELGEDVPAAPRHPRQAPADLDTPAVTPGRDRRRDVAPGWPRIVDWRAVGVG